MILIRLYSNAHTLSKHRVEAAQNCQQCLRALLYSIAHVVWKVWRGLYPHSLSNNSGVYQISCARGIFRHPWKFYTFFWDSDIILSSYTMFINASTMEFTLVNNAISSYDIAFKHLLYYMLAPPILWSWHIANTHRNISSI